MSICVRSSLEDAEIARRVTLGNPIVIVERTGSIGDDEQNYCLVFGPEDLFREMSELLGWPVHAELTALDTVDLGLEAALWAIARAYAPRGYQVCSSLGEAASVASSPRFSLALTETNSLGMDAHPCYVLVGPELFMSALQYLTRWATFLPFPLSLETPEGMDVEQLENWLEQNFPGMREAWGKDSGWPGSEPEEAVVEG